MQFRWAAVAALVAFVVIAPPAAAQTLADGLGAYRDNRIAEAERILTEVAADPATSTADRAGALRELGRIDGLVRGETDAIAAAMAQTPNGEDACGIAALALRLYRNAGEPATPLAYAEAATDACPAPSEEESLRVELARTRLALARAEPPARELHLAAAAAALNGQESVASTDPDVASTRLAVAITQRNADGALAAWRDYYWLADADAPPALNAYAGRVQSTFQAALRTNATDADVLAMLDLLVRAGFVADARRLAAETGIAARAGETADWRRITAFLAFDETARAATLRANREMAQGGRAAWYEGEIAAARDHLMQDAALSGDPEQALVDAFGVYGSLGETSGYPSLHAGHLVQDEEIAVEQYGRRGALRFRVIDNMIANGFESWLWDGWAQAGGWSRGDGIVQVRSAYTSGPLSALRRARPGSARDRFLAEIERAALEERRALGRDGIAQLTATSDRLHLQAIDQIAARAPSDGDFIAEYWRALVQYSITLHEGRHALDRQEPRRFSGADLEYRAKLSQIALADYPRLGLANVAGQTIGDTAHGRANRRLLQGYRAWMRRYRAEIADFDRSAPTLTQLHLLTDDQIRTAAQSLDPWAR